MFREWPKELAKEHEKQQSGLNSQNGQQAIVICHLSLWSIGYLQGRHLSDHSSPFDFSGALFQQRRLASSAFLSVISLAAAQVHFYSLVSVMQNNSFSICSSFWLFLPRHIIPYLSTLNFILSPIMPSPSMIWAPLCLIIRFGDLLCLQKLSFADLKFFLAGPLGGSLASVTQRQLCKCRKKHIGHGSVRFLENTVTPKPSSNPPHSGLPSCHVPTIRVSLTVHRLQLRFFMPSSLASIAFRNLNFFFFFSVHHFFFKVGYNCFTLLY